jgi:hypothetical protein
LAASRLRLVPVEKTSDWSSNCSVGSLLRSVISSFNDPMPADATERCVDEECERMEAAAAIASTMIAVNDVIVRCLVMGTSVRQPHRRGSREPRRGFDGGTQKISEAAATYFNCAVGRFRQASMLRLETPMMTGIPRSIALAIRSRNPRPERTRRRAEPSVRLATVAIAR